MKFNLKLPRKIFVGMSLVTLCSFLFASSSYADNESMLNELELRKSESYEEWLSLPDELQREIPIPSNSSATITNEIKIKYLTEPIPSIITALQPVEGYSLEQVGANYTDSSYNLNKDAKIRIKNQKTTNECWAFSVISSFESNMSLLGGNSITKDYSERHMDYATSRTFLDGENPIGFGREVGVGGLAENGYAYLTNGTGAVLEEYMPFENDESKINLSSINQPIESIATGYGRLPSIYKKYKNGETLYYDMYGQELQESDVKAYRNIIKNHIIKYGAVSTIQAANKTQYYDNPETIAKAKSYYCNDENVTQDHELTIVGWDDNYSRYNFNPNSRPTHDGAYICLNTYGPNVFDGGYIYVSYDDVLVEKALLGVRSTSNVDYDNLYQHDFYGGYFEIGTSNYDTGYYGCIFERSSKNQYLSKVGIQVSQYAKVDVYLNPNGTDLNVNNMIKIGSYDLEPGYTRVDVSKVQINSQKFAIVVKQIQAIDTGFYFPIESRVANSVYEYVSATPGTSFVSFNGTDFEDITKFAISNIDMSTADVCIKAFTIDSTIENPPEQEDPPEHEDPPTPQNPGNNESQFVEEELGDNNNNNENIDPNNYSEVVEEVLDPINNNNQENNENNENNNENNENNNQENEEIDFKEFKLKGYDVYNIPLGMTYSQFKSRIDLKGKQVKFYKNNDEITDLNSLVSTGSIMMVDDVVDVIYTFILTGDVNGDGMLTLTDVSKVLVHYNAFTGMALKGAFLKAADMNGDELITLTDLSKIFVIYNALP